MITRDLLSFADRATGLGENLESLSPSDSLLAGVYIRGLVRQCNHLAMENTRFHKESKHWKRILQTKNKFADEIEMFVRQSSDTMEESEGRKWVARLCDRLPDWALNIRLLEAENKICFKYMFNE